MTEVPFPNMVPFSKDATTWQANEEMSGQKCEHAYI